MSPINFHVVPPRVFESLHARTTPTTNTTSTTVLYNSYKHTEALSQCTNFVVMLLSQYRNTDHDAFDKLHALIPAVSLQSPSTTHISSTLTVPALKGMVHKFLRDAHTQERSIKLVWCIDDLCLSQPLVQ